MKATAPVSSRKKKSTKNTHIEIKGARVNNLKNIDLKIPKNQLVVVTGVSGSGKSSITMDTLYAEGQRRYVESLSSYARQFLGRMKKPDVDYIKGLCPAIAIEQKVSTRNARSTVGSLTETYDYLRLLYARVGRTISPISGKEVKKHKVSDVMEFLKSQKEDSKIQLFVPLQSKYDRSFKLELELLLQKGYTRFQRKGELHRIEDSLESKDKILKKKTKQLQKEQIFILIDRFVIRHEDDDNWKRIADSVQQCFSESEGDCIIDLMKGKTKSFNNRFELDGMIFIEPSHHLFNYNNPFGACPVCEGFGKVMGISEEKVVPNKTKSVYDGAIACWSGEKLGKWKTAFIKAAHYFDFPVHKAYQDLSNEERELLWEGNEYFDGVNAFFKELESKSYKIQNRVLLARYRGRTDCYDCKGGRLRKEAQYIQVGKKHIMELVKMPIDELLVFFNKLKLRAFEKSLAKRIVLEVTQRLEFMCNVGLNYLTLDRISSTLSGGETQRINLTRTLGSNLTNSMYILDEPSVGLHPKDTAKLVKVLKALRDLGNTVIVVEHEEDVIKNADYLVDIGPEAGIHGGDLVYGGPYKQILTKAKNSLTTKYLTGKMSIAVPETRRRSANKIYIKGARQHNLKNIDVTLPLNAFTVISGVSGSGKTSLVKHILYPALKQALGEHYRSMPGVFDALEGDVQSISQVELVNQNPIGKSSRSNPVTYVKAYDSIRTLMSNQQLSKIRGFKPKHFSFNVEGGRCDACNGEGEQVIEMQFLADVRLECEDCKGRRFKNEVLDVKYMGKNIFDILDMSIDEAIEFFKSQKDVIKKIKPLSNVGLGYIKLGQSSSTLSGGEAQRVKLASFLNKERNDGQVFFIFDEPTTGLHFHDINKLLGALNALIEKGHTVLVVEHNMEVIKSADWVIDLGPEGGKNGGKLVFQGSPEGLAKCKRSLTGEHLKEKLS